MTGAAARRAAGVLMMAIGLLGPSAPVAGADQRVVAGPGTRYATPTVSIAQGEGLLLFNQDITGHDVVAVASGPDGEPLFRSPLVAPGREAEVAGVKYLTTGEYAFVCSIHPAMRGSLAVSAAGVPLSPPDRRPPVLAASLRPARLAAAARGVRVRIASDEAATVRLRALARAGGRVFRGRESVLVLAAGETRTLRLALPAAARRTIARARRAVVEATALAVDGAGNSSALTVRRTLRR
jgi:plastocyanin